MELPSNPRQSKWIVSTDEFDPTMQVFDNEKMAREGYKEFITEREFDGRTYRIYLAEVKEFSGDEAPWRKGD